MGQHVNRAQMEEIVEQYEEGDSEYIVIDVRTPGEVTNTGKLGPNVLTLPVQVIMEKDIFALEADDFEDIAGFENQPRIRRSFFPVPLESVPSMPANSRVKPDIPN